MSRQRFRRPEGGLIDRSRPLGFTFDGRAYGGYEGDTLASALLANGVRLVGRSLKYHRPRGIFGVGAEEPNALVRLRLGGRAEPNVRATQVELYDGLVASSQNRWPALRLDLGAAVGLGAPFLPAGFYYKTFMGPGRAWKFYERFIRRAVGLGRAPAEPDPDHYEKRHHHCDVLVIGAGPAGLAAALAAGARGARVLLVDEGATLGGTLRAASVALDDGPAMAWVERAAGNLESMSRVRVLPRAAAFGYYDHNLVAVAERVADHRPAPGPFAVRQRLWLVRAREVVLATGSIERPLVFVGNDRPGVMLASAARAYANQYGVRCGGRAVLFTNNDSAYVVARELAAAGVEVAAVVDTRETGPARGLVRGLRGLGIESLAGYAVTRVIGGSQVRGVEVRNLSPRGDACFGAPRLMRCDLVGLAGGWNPTVHLFSQSRGRLAYSESLAAFLPGESRQRERSAGAANGTFALAECFVEGLAAGAEAAAAAGYGQGAVPPPPLCVQEDAAAPRALWVVPRPAGRGGKQFVDLQNDVTVDDIRLAAREGYDSVELLKRYTTLGMGTDQGRTSNVNALAILAGERGHDIPRVGTTTFRPPYTPVTLGLLAGHAQGQGLAPVRRTPLHDWHVAAGAELVTAGLWMRPRYYPREDEGLAAASRREARAVRAAVGVVDVSTLGKIEVQGAGAAEFLEQIYANRVRPLAVGRARYGVMLREDGLIMDDGTITRLGPQHFYLTTTTARAGQVMSHLERHAQITWPGLEVYITSVTDQWAAMALAGPESRRTLAKAAGRFDVGDGALPFLGYREARIAGAPARLFRITYSGELAYEIHTPSDYGVAVWKGLIEAGREFGIVPYGTEAMGILRIEKGHAVVGAEIDGRTTPADIGLGRMAARDGDFIGKRSLELPALCAPDRKRLVGLISHDPAAPIPAGAQLMTDAGRLTGSPGRPADGEGHVTSTTWSPHLGGYLALALLAGGASRHGETVHAVSPLTAAAVPVTVTGPVFVDPRGTRPRG